MMFGWQAARKSVSQPAKALSPKERKKILLTWQVQKIKLRKGQKNVRREKTNYCSLARRTQRRDVFSRAPGSTENMFSVQHMAKFHQFLPRPRSTDTHVFGCGNGNYETEEIYCFSNRSAWACLNGAHSLGMFSILPFSYWAYFYYVSVAT